MDGFYSFFRIRKALAGNVCHSEEEFNKKLSVECSRLTWNEQEFSLLLLTLKPAHSSPKKIYAVIKKLQYRIRDIDIIGRYNDRSIGVILPYTTEKGAKGFIHKIKNSMEDLRNNAEFTLYKYFPDENNPEKIQWKQY